MIIKYINEGVFGSYKKGFKDEDKKKLMHQQLNIIHKKEEEKFTKQLWEDVVSKVSLQKVERGYYFDCGLNLISDLFGHEQDVPIQAEYKKEGKTLNVFVRVLVYAADLRPRQKIKDDFDIGTFHHKEVMSHHKSILNKLKSRSERYGAALRKKLKNWFDVDEIVYTYKYHLVDPDDPFVLFNKDIHYSVLIYAFSYGYNIKVFSEFVDTCFEWFHITTDIFKVGNVQSVMSDGKCALEQYAKYIKTSVLKIGMTIENDIESFGNYKKIFIDTDIASNDGETGRVDLDWIATSLDNFNKNQVQKVHSNSVMFTDKLLMELVGHTNQEILDYEGYDKSYLPNHIIFNAFEDNSDIGNLDIGYARKPAYMGRYEHV